MKAIAMFPGKPNSAHLTELPKPTLDEIKDGTGVLVKILRVGVDGTDKEINAAEYGAAPAGYDFLVTGHEGFGQVEAAGPNVVNLKPGDYVVALVRRPGQSIYDQIGMQDMTTDSVYYERGINLLHGFLAEYYVDAERYIVKIPKGLREVAVLLEPFTVVEKGIRQAYEAQRRLKVWRPVRAAITGAGTVGLLAALALRIRGIQVTVFSREQKPNRRIDLLEQLGAHYLSTQEKSLADGAAEFGPFDLILEATGYSPLAFDCMEMLARNGALVLASVTGGDRTVTVHSDKINLGFVLGNKLAVGTVNANREDFEEGVRDMAMAEAEWPGWLGSLLTDKVDGLDNFAQIYDKLLHARDAIKIYCEVAPLP